MAHQLLEDAERCGGGVRVVRVLGFGAALGRVQLEQILHLMQEGGGGGVGWRVGVCGAAGLAE
jgi:hypothetical protein